MLALLVTLCALRALDKLVDHAITISTSEGSAFSERARKCPGFRKNDVISPLRCVLPVHFRSNITWYPPSVAIPNPRRKTPRTESTHTNKKWNRNKTPDVHIDTRIGEENHSSIEKFRRDRSCS